MPEYAYKALNSEGRKVSGKAHANDVGALAERLDDAGQTLLKARAIKPLFSVGSSKIPKMALINFSLMLSLMLKAGVTILEALQDIADAEANPALRRVIMQLADSLGSGKTLSQAMSVHPKVFDEVYVNLIQAGEQTGQLTEVLESLTDTLKWQHEIASQAKKAMIYPVIVFIVITGVTMFLLATVVPQIASLLKSMRVELPWQTRLLIVLSDFVSKNWQGILLSFLIIPFVLYFFLKLPGPVAAWLDRVKLKTPIMGKVFRQIALARFSYVLAMLYAAGVTVVDALKVVEKAVGNQALASAVRSATFQIVKGKNLSAAFAGSSLFPTMVVSMLRVGEATGSLDTALKNVSYLYTREARESVEGLQATLQPVLTVVLGLILGLIMVFTLGPLYESVVSNAKF